MQLRNNYAVLPYALPSPLKSPNHTSTLYLVEVPSTPNVNPGSTISSGGSAPKVLMDTPALNTKCEVLTLTVPCVP